MRTGGRESATSLAARKGSFRCVQVCVCVRAVRAHVRVCVWVGGCAWLLSLSLTCGLASITGTCAHAYPLCPEYEIKLNFWHMHLVFARPDLESVAAMNTTTIGRYVKIEKVWTCVTNSRGAEKLSEFAEGTCEGDADRFEKQLFSDFNIVFRHAQPVTGKRHFSGRRVGEKPGETIVRGHCSPGDFEPQFWSVETVKHTFHKVSSQDWEATRIETHRWKVDSDPHSFFEQLGFKVHRMYRRNGFIFQFGNDTMMRIYTITKSTSFQQQQQHVDDTSAPHFVEICAVGNKVSLQSSRDPAKVLELKLGIEKLISNTEGYESTESKNSAEIRFPPLDFHKLNLAAAAEGNGVEYAPPLPKGNRGS